MHFMVDEPVAEVLDRRAEREGISRGEVIRRGLQVAYGTKEPAPTMQDIEELDRRLSRIEQAMEESRGY